MTGFIVNCSHTSHGSEALHKQLGCCLCASAASVTASQACAMFLPFASAFHLLVCVDGQALWCQLRTITPALLFFGHAQLLYNPNINMPGTNSYAVSTLPLLILWHDVDNVF